MAAQTLNNFNSLDSKLSLLLEVEEVYVAMFDLMQTDILAVIRWTLEIIYCNKVSFSSGL